MQNKQIPKTKQKFRYLYGPVASWRLGSSLGIDLLAGREKLCNFSCLYCQIGQTQKYQQQRAVFVSTEEIINEIRNIPDGLPIDYFTFSGRGEPTLAANIGEVIREVRRLRKEPLSLLTNSVLLVDPAVRKEIFPLDSVTCKLDACSPQVFQAVNQPGPGIELESIKEGIIQFRREFSGKLALQLMFITANRAEAAALADFARRLHPDEIELNTPLRPSQASPLSPENLETIEQSFTGMPVRNVYKTAKKSVQPLDKEATDYRRGYSR